MLNKDILNKDFGTFIFDCDGVILNSNQIKSNAFYETALFFSEDIADNFKKYHIENGGISRYKKFKYLLDILVKNNTNIITLDELLYKYKQIIYDKLISSEVATGLFDLKKTFNNTNWIVVSGGDQLELRTLFDIKNISSFFNLGIFGSPETKIEIINKQLKENKIKYPVLFFGDSKYDYDVSKFFNFDFIFVSNWTELNNWKEFCANNNLIHIPNLEFFLNRHD
jgi:phosphoglycolate phosphatase-like HAD superfamily hydrolase